MLYGYYAGGDYRFLFTAIPNWTGGCRYRARPAVLVIVWIADAFA